MFNQKCVEYDHTDANIQYNALKNKQYADFFIKMNKNTEYLYRYTKFIYIFVAESG